MLPHAWLQNPNQDKAAVDIHHRKQVIPTFISMNPDVFNVQAKMLQWPACLDTSELYKFAFAFSTDFLSQQQTVFIHQPVNFFIIDLISPLAEFICCLMV